MYFIGECSRTGYTSAASYETLRHAIGRRYNRTPGTFETYQYLSIVLDPYRGDEVCVLPAPSALAGGVRAVEV